MTIQSRNLNKQRPGNRRPVRLFILSSQDIYCCGVADRLSQVEYLKTHVSYGDEANLMENFREFEADVLFLHQKMMNIWAAFMPVQNLIAKFTEMSPNVRIIMFDCDFDETQTRTQVRAGVHGVLNHDVSIEETLSAIHAVSDGLYWLDDVISNALIKEAIYRKELIDTEIQCKADMFRKQLTKREADVFSLLFQGQPTKVIAKQIGLTEQSIKLHLWRMYKKFHVTNRTQLILEAIKFISPSNNMMVLFNTALQTDTPSPLDVGDTLTRDVHLS